MRLDVEVSAQRRIRGRPERVIRPDNIQTYCVKVNSYIPLKLVASHTDIVSGVDFTL